MSDGGEVFLTAGGVGGFFSAGGGVKGRVDLCGKQEILGG